MPIGITASNAEDIDWLFVFFTKKLNTESVNRKDGLDIFEITDKTGRKIRLTQERWSHITREHPEIVNLEEVKDTLISPFTIYGT